MASSGCMQAPGFPRRRVLSMLPALTIPMLVSREALGGSLPAEKPLSITPADSLYYYKSLLGAVFADANQKGWQEQLNASQACNNLVGRLREKLQKLYDKLAEAPRQTDWHSIHNHFNAIQRNLLLVQQSNPGQFNPHTFNLLPVTTASLASLLYEVSERCDPDPHGEIKALLKEAFEEIDSQNEGLRHLTAQLSDAQALYDETATWYRDCANYIDKASEALAAATENQNKIQLLNAKEYLGSAKTELEHFIVQMPTSGLSSKETLLKLLDATLRSLDTTVSVVSASLNILDIDGAAVPATQLDSANSTLISYVRKVVRKGFTPGITLQVINCIAVCWPIWVLYIAESEAATRKQLVYAALSRGLCWGANPQLYETTADDLQKAFVISSGLQKA